MSNYQKLIVSGNIAELYEYERTPRVLEMQDVYGRVERNRRKPEDAQRLVRRQDNAHRAQVAFGRLCSANFDGSEIPIFVTLSFKPTEEWEQPSIKQGYKLLELFIKRMRTRYGSHFRYIAVPEHGTKSTKRLHFHALFWGLPLADFERERETRNFAKIWQNGFVDLVITNNDVKVGFYLAKYLSKSYKNPEFFGSNSYVCSRNVRRPEVYNSFIGLTLDLILGVDNSSPSIVKSYDTLHLGRCDYKLYNLKET